MLHDIANKSPLPVRPELIEGQSHNLYFVILAGGNGTRLWPISRENKPKQFIEIGNNKTLIDQAIDRIAPLVPKENIWVSTTENHAENIKQQVGHKIGKIILEPCARNTAPAILLACLEIQKVNNSQKNYSQANSSQENNSHANPNPEACVIFLPSDPFIPDTEKFVTCLQNAINFIENNDKIALLGVRPTHPATGYGYIEFNSHPKLQGENTAQSPIAPEGAKQAQAENYPSHPLLRSSRSFEGQAHKVLKFHEKPNLQTAKEYLREKNIVWNIGTFCAKVHVFVQEFEIHAPEIFACVSNYVNNISSYSKVNPESIDYAIMEKSENIFVIPGDFQWYDVGNIEIFLNIQKQYMQLDENTILVDSKNNLVKAKDKLVALVGVDDLCVVETDNIILITRRDKAEQVREIVKQLKESNNVNYL